MKLFNFIQQRRLIAFTSSCLLSGLMYQSIPVQAQSIDSASSGISGQIHFTPPPDLSGSGRPVQRRQAASQGEGNCTANPSSSGEELLWALVPRLDVEAQTVSDSPTLWFYVPYQASDFEEMQFVLWDASQNTISQMSFTATTVLPGVISVQPEASLQVGQSYEWRFILTCGGDTSLTVSGWITRIEQSPELTNDLAAATTPQAQATAYARHGIWFEALTVLSNLHHTRSDEATLSDWSDLLVEVGLESLVIEPIVDCCRP
jgi:hypothetical protein